MKRAKMSKNKSKKVFRSNTGIQKINNLNPRVMRGGIRL